MANVIEGELPEGGRLFAAFDETARFVTPAVAHSRFGALLSPFASEAAAREGLAAAGAEPVAKRKGVQ